MFPHLLLNLKACRKNEITTFDFGPLWSLNIFQQGRGYASDYNSIDTSRWNVFLSLALNG